MACEPLKASHSRDGPPVRKERFHTKDSVADLWSDVAVLEKNMRPASNIPNALPQASERTTSLREYCGAPSPLLKLCSSKFNFEELSVWSS